MLSLCTPHGLVAKIDRQGQLMDEIVTISGDGLTARIKHMGAELCSLVGPANEEVLWQAGAAWPRHAPILFPIAPPGEVN